MTKEQFLQEAEEKINTLTKSVGIETGDLKEKAQQELNKLLADKSSLSEKFEALKNAGDDKWEEAKKAFSDVTSSSLSEGIQKGIDAVKNLF